MVLVISSISLPVAIEINTASPPTVRLREAGRSPVKLVYCSGTLAKISTFSVPVTSLPAVKVTEASPLLFVTTTGVFSVPPKGFLRLKFTSTSCTGLSLASRTLAIILVCPLGAKIGVTA